MSWSASVSGHVVDPAKAPQVEAKIKAAIDAVVLELLKDPDSGIIYANWHGNNTGPADMLVEQRTVLAGQQQSPPVNVPVPDGHQPSPPVSPPVPPIH